MDYLDDSRWEIERYLSQQNIRIDMFTEQMINDMAYQYYKNYYSYEMDQEYAALAAVSVVMKENHIEIDGFEEWA